MKPRIGILTSFTGSDSAYSLVNVVRVQIEMLLTAGYRPVLFVAEPFQFSESGVWSGKRIEIRKVGLHTDNADTIANKLRDKCQDIHVMLCHDLVFLVANAGWGGAIRQLAKETGIFWVHWQHSRGDGQTEPCDNSWYAYPNQGDLQHVADYNRTTLDRVAYVPHPLDFAYLGWPDLAINIAEDTGHPFADVSIFLPTRLDRQKQVEKAVRLAAGCKKTGKTVSMIVGDAYATGERFIQYKDDIKEIAQQQGFENELVFLNDRYEECFFATPRDTVKALYEMSNLFVQPSNAETSSLVALEASLAGNLLIINSDFQPIHHLYSKALSLPFGSVTQSKPTEYYRHMRLTDGTMQKIIDNQLFWDDQARETIIPALDAQLIATVKKQQFRDRWPSRVFKNHLEPLILKAYAEACLDSKFVDIAPNYDNEVTAIITTIDNLPLLERQIEVLLSEVGHIIVVNNGSQDGTLEWLETNQYPRLSYINRENLGAGPGRNAGLDMWAFSTPYTLMLDGGILPPKGGVKLLKEYLHDHPEIDVISPEIETCFTTELEKATHTVSAPITASFPQRCISSTAYALCRAKAWNGIRLSEEGPFGEPGWGVDDQDLQYRWNEAGIVHHDFTNSSSGWKLYRRKSGSFERLFKETGIWPNQYGSVYEARNVKCYQDWYAYHSWVFGARETPTAAYVIEGVQMPEFAMLVKRLHDDDPYCEIVCQDDSDPAVKRWLDTFALRWQWGDCTIDPDGKILKRGVDYPEELWSGNVVRNRGPLVDALVIMPENMGAYIERELILQAA